MKNTLRTTSFAALFTCLTVTAHAAVTVTADNFNSYPLGAAAFPTNVQFGTATVVPDGGGGNAVLVTGTASGGGFYAPGLEWNPIVQPGAAGPNTSTNLADYTISFDLTINSTYKANGFELWISYGNPDGIANEAIPDDGSNLYGISVAGFTTGIPQTLTFAMGAGHFPPGQYGDPFDPTVDQWHIQLNGIDFNSTAGDTLSFTTDNFQVAVIPEPSTYALLLGGMCGLVGVRRRKS